MNIRKVPKDKKAYFDLLLLADERESMIDKHLERGEMFVYSNRTMKRFAKIGLVILSIILVAFIFQMIKFIYTWSPHPFTKEEMIKDFSKNREVLEYITDYMKYSEYEFMSANDWDINKGILVDDKLKGTFFINIENSVKLKFNYLFKNLHYSAVLKDKNSIFFTRYSSFKLGQGVAYSLNGSTPQYELLKKLEAIGDNWYFYECE